MILFFKWFMSIILVFVLSFVKFVRLLVKDFYFVFNSFVYIFKNMFFK